MKRAMVYDRSHLSTVLRCRYCGWRAVGLTGDLDSLASRHLTLEHPKAAQ